MAATSTIFSSSFFNENVSIPISLKFIPKGSIDNVPALIQIMASHRPGYKPLSGPIMDNIYVLLGLNELILPLLFFYLDVGDVQYFSPTLQWHVH